MKIPLILLVISLFIMPASALNGISVSPAILKDDGTLTITNAGDTPLNYDISFCQVMMKDNQQVIVDGVQPDISVNEKVFRLNPGESKTVQVTVGNTENKLYGIRISGAPDEGATKIGVSVIVKVDIDGNVEAINNNLLVTPKFLPVALSGVPISVTYNLDNQGNVPESFMDKTLYPGDTGSVTKSYDTAFLSGGFVDCDGNQVFVIPTPLLIVLLIGGLVFFLRRKVEVNLK